MDNFDSGLKIVKASLKLMEDSGKKYRETGQCDVESLDAMYAFLKDLNDMFEKFVKSKQDFLEYLRNDNSKEMFTRRIVELKFKIIFNLGLGK